MPRPPLGDVIPERTVLAQWREAQAVCFDVDCTVTLQDSLDLLAEFMGRGEQVASLTNKVGADDGPCPILHYTPLQASPP